MAVDIEIGNVSVHSLTHVVGQPAHGQDVSRAIESDAIIEVETLTRHDFFGDRLQSCVVGLKVGHFFMILQSKGGPPGMGWVKIC